jgi:hypothetical protein
VVSYDEGLEVTKEIVEEVEEIYKKHITYPTGILVDKKNHYNINHEAMIATASITKKISFIKCFAILVHSMVSEMAAQSQKTYNFNMEVFTEIDKAIEWIREQVKKSR